MEIVFDQIDKKNGTARMIGNNGAENVIAIDGRDSVHLVEITASGNMNITTIFQQRDARRNSFAGVHSRHVTLMSGGPLPSQYVGLCSKLN